MKKRVSLAWQIGIAMMLGLIVGPVLGPRAFPLGELGKAVVNLIKTIAAPLLFLTIVYSVVQTQVRLQSALRMLGSALLNSSIALTIGLILSNWLQPGKLLTLKAPVGESVVPVVPQAPEFNLVKSITGLVPTSVVQPFAENQVLTLVGLALLTGAALRRVKFLQEREGRSAWRALEGAIGTAQEVTVAMIQWMVYLAPIAVFGVVAKATAEHGFAPLVGLGAYVGVALLGLAIMSGVYQLWIHFFARISLREFWGAAKEPVAYAVGSNSSLATLPLTLSALDRLKISRNSSTLGACVGTNFNQDGIILYEAMAALFVAQACGIDLSLSQQAMVAGVSMVAAAGVGGVPEAGFISLAVVLGAVGVPTEILPLLLSVDWIVARGRTVANVLSDMTLSIMIERLEKGQPLRAPSEANST